MGRTRSGEGTPTVLAVGARILLVEDDRDLRELLVFALESDGYSVRTAENGVDALVQLEFGPRPDVILLNLVLPLMLGSELLESVRQDARLTRIPVVLITGAPVPVAVATLANAVLPKPFGLDQLAETIVGLVPREDPPPAPRPRVNT
jgi:two-component system, response regulator, stage 0 sporulation protein F